MLEQVTEALEQALRDKRLAEEASEFFRRTSDVRHTCDTMQHSATHYNTLQHTATHCNTLQHTATHCNTR